MKKLMRRLFFGFVVRIARLALRKRLRLLDEVDLPAITRIALLESYRSLYAVSYFLRCNKDKEDEPLLRSQMDLFMAACEAFCAWTHLLGIHPRSKEILKVYVEDGLINFVFQEVDEEEPNARHQ